MKRAIYFFIILVIMINMVACKSLNNPGTDRNEVEENTSTPSATPTLEPSKAPTVAPTDEPEPTKEPEERLTETEITGMANDILKTMTVEEKVASMFVVNLELLDESKGNYYEHRKITKKMKKALSEYPVGGIIFFARNIETREQTMKLIDGLQEASKFPLFISVDEEGGDVARIASNDNMQTTKFPPMEEVGKLADEEYAYQIGSTIAEDIKSLGFNVNFAPVADVKTNELNTEIGNRSFGDDAKLVAKMVKQFVKGTQDQGISATLKHFPGHGSASEDTHLGAVNIDSDITSLRKVEFVPFKAGIKEKADFVMVSHVSISRVTENTLPASLSSLVMNEMLRKELGFEGVIITDAMNMKAITEDYSAKEAAVKAVEAGVDMILMPEDFIEAYEGVLEAVKNLEIEESRIDDSVLRILKTKIRRGLITSDSNLLPR